MTCIHCQNEMNPQERFCSKCGKNSQAERVQPSYKPEARNWDTHIKAVAWIFIIGALFMAIPGLSLMLFPGMIMVGMPHAPFHFAGPIFMTIGLAFLSIPIGMITTGIGLLRYRDWARVLALILAAFMLIGFPFGTAIGVYVFWVFLSNEGSASYRRGPSPGGRGWAYSSNAASREG